MKRILSIAALLLVIQFAHAQKTVLALNEHNRYVYYQVVDVAGFSADSLKKNSASFINYTYPKNKSKQVSDTGVNVKDKFLTYGNALLKRENGEMAYSFNIECRNGKYRYWITDFVFTPYVKDRYSQLVPAVGASGTPLETAKDKLTKKELDDYLNQTSVFCKQLADKLKLYMVTGHVVKKSEPKPAKVVTDKW